MSTNAISIPEPEGRVESKIAETILDFLGRIPITNKIKSDLPIDRARSITSAAAAKAAITSGSLALPPGPLGWLTILPELIAIWKIQAQMVADIAGTFGKDASLTREQMFCCKKSRLKSCGLTRPFVATKNWITGWPAPIRLMRCLPAHGLAENEPIVLDT